MTEIILYPAWRYHKSGVTAVIYSEAEDKTLNNDWVGYLPEGFVVPRDAHYHGLDRMPDELKRRTLTLPKKNGNNDRA